MNETQQKELTAAQPKGTDWNEQASFYNKFAFCELEDTQTYLDAIDIHADESVLDVCCGPGRISVLAAQRCKQVTGIDSAEKMLEAASENARERELENVEFRLLDWEHVLPGQNLDRHDVVIASRCAAMTDVAKLSELANRMVAIQIFADGPSLPALVNVLYSGCGEDPHMPAGNQGMPGAGGPAGGPGMPGAGGPKGKRAGGMYLHLVKKVHDEGFDPNLRVFPERFRKTFATREQAYEFVCSLRPERAKGFEQRVAVNTDPFLTQTDAGIEFCIATAAAIIWWDVRGPARWLF